MELLSPQTLTETDIWAALETVKDPEIPALSVVDMGMIVSVNCQSPTTTISVFSDNLQPLTVNSVFPATCHPPPATSHFPATSAHVVMTPTFVGCPAIGIIKKDIYEAVKKLGFDEVEVQVDMETAWTSNRMKPGAKEKLEQFGIAPPVNINDEELTAEMLDRVRCPHCHSTDTTLRSTFGSTLCRAIRFCFSCRQGFEQFKPL